MRPSLGLWLALAGFVIALDQATKAWIVETFGLGERGYLGVVG